MFSLIPTNTVIIDNTLAFDAMLKDLENHRIYALDTETVGIGTLLKFEEIEELKQNLKEAAISHCLKFPRLDTSEPSRNTQKGAKTSLQKVMRIKDLITKKIKASQKDLSGLRYWDCYLGCVQIALNNGTFYAIRPKAVSPEQWQALARTLNLKGKIILLHNAVFDICQLAHHCKIWIDGRNIFDTMIAEWCLTLGLDMRKSLLATAKRHLGIALTKDASIRISNWLNTWSLRQLNYAAQDVMILFPLYEALKAELFKKGMKRAHRLRCDFTLPCAILNMSGLPLDLEALEKYKKTLEQEIKYLDAQIRSQGQVQDDFNPNSSHQVYQMLLEQGILVNDTNEKTLLESDYSDHPIVHAILDYRGACKALSFVNTYLNFNIAGRMHSQFHITGTHSGRMSSGNANHEGSEKDPYICNAQQIPKDKNIRGAIKAPPGRKFIDADYSQIQIRWTARYSNDPVMLQAYQNNEDLHAITAKTISHLSNAEWDALSDDKKAALRQKAKAVNFGLLFGGGPDMLVKYAKVQYEVILTLDEAKAIKKTWGDKYKRLTEWGGYFQTWTKNATENGYIKTVDGLIRWFKNPYKEDKKKDEIRYKFIYTESLNTPAQAGEAAGIINGLNIFTYSLLDDGYKPLKDFWLTNIIHDQLLIETLGSYTEDFSKRLAEAMELGMMEFIVNIPVKVEPKIVQTWSEAK